MEGLWPVSYTENCIGYSDGRPIFLWILGHVDLHFIFLRSYQIFAFSKDNSKRNCI